MGPLSTGTDHICCNGMAALLRMQVIAEFGWSQPRTAGQHPVARTARVAGAQSTAVLPHYALQAHLLDHSPTSLVCMLISSDSKSSSKCMSLQHESCCRTSISSTVLELSIQKK